MLEVVERWQYNNRKVMEFGVKLSVKMKMKKANC
jgi:flavin-binding protein dodecin